MLQSGMVLDSCTIQLLILSLRRRSTVGTGVETFERFIRDPATTTPPHDGRLTFVVLRSPFLVSGTARSLLLPGKP